MGYMDLYVLMPNPDLVLIPLSMLMSLLFNGVGGVLRDDFIGVLVK